MENGEVKKPAADVDAVATIKAKKLDNGLSNGHSGGVVPSDVAAEAEAAAAVTRNPKQSGSTPTAEEVTFCHFDQLFDLSLTKVLLNIFLRVDVADLEACIRVCHSWRVFIGRHLVCGADHELRSRLVRRKLPLDWLGLSGSPGPKVTRIPITKTLAPPLRIEADERDVVMSTVDSLLVWDRTTKRFKGEIGPEIDGSNHCMVQSLSFNETILVTLHKHTSVMLVWSRATYNIIQEIPCTGIDGTDNCALFAKARKHGLVVWQEDGSIVVYNMMKNGILRRRQVLNGHIQGSPDAALDDPHLLTASGDSKVNLWDVEAGRLLWSNSRSDARYRLARLSGRRAVAAGSYDQEGYLQIYDRLTGEVVHEMLAMEGSGFQDVAATDHRVVALLAVRHKLLTCKALILDADSGDPLAEQTFVDVLDMRVVFDRVLVLVNNQVGDFRTRISVFDLGEGDGGDSGGQNKAVFENERVAFQYEHNYWRLPIFLDDWAIVHTTEEKSDLVIREFDTFFKQFSAADKAGRLLTPGEMERRRKISSSTLCYRLRRLLFKKICSKCTIM